MAVVALGMDIAEVPRVAALIAKHGDAFLEKIFTPAERAVVASRKNKPALRAEHWAVRFACKEAVMKALGTGLAQGVRWHDIEIAHDALGAPRLSLTGNAGSIAKTLGVKVWLVTLSHTHGLAVAVVVGEGGKSSKRKTQSSQLRAKNAKRKMKAPKRRAGLN